MRANIGAGDRRTSGLCIPALLAAAVLGGCGGGGGGGDDGDDGPGEFLLAQYEFAVTNPAGAPAPLTRTQLTPGQDPDTYSVDAGTGTIRGLYTLASRNLSVDVATSYTVDWSEGGPVPAQFSVGITSAASYPAGDFIPGTGAFAVTWGTDTITVQYGATVQVALNGGAPASFAPFDFLQLDQPVSAAPDWQRVAARASRALVDVLNPVRAAGDFLESVYDGDFDSGQAVNTCATIPGTPPDGVGQVGEIVTTALGGGDYDTMATDCFGQATGSPTVGVLLSGGIERRNLVSDADGSGAIVRAGFVGSAGSPGGIAYDSRQRTMNEALPGVWVFSGNEVTLDGGFSIEFTEP